MGTCESSLPFQRAQQQLQRPPRGPTLTRRSPCHRPASIAPIQSRSCDECFPRRRSGGRSEAAQGPLAHIATTVPIARRSCAARARSPAGSHEARAQLGRRSKNFVWSVTRPPGRAAPQLMLPMASNRRRRPAPGRGRQPGVEVPPAHPSGPTQQLAHPSAPAHPSDRRRMDRLPTAALAAPGPPHRRHGRRSEHASDRTGSERDESGRAEKLEEQSC